MSTRKVNGLFLCSINCWLVTSESLEMSLFTQEIDEWHAFKATTYRYMLLNDREKTNALITGIS